MKTSTVASTQVFLSIFLSLCISYIDGFASVPGIIRFTSKTTREIRTTTTRTSSTRISAGASKIPSSIAERDKDAIQSIRYSLDRVSYPLIECEFPVLQSLNKLGDGSLRSTIEAQDANLAFVDKLVKELNGFLGFGGKSSTLVMSSSASNSFTNQVKQKMKKVISLKDDGISKNTSSTTINKKEVFIFLTPSSKTDFQIAKQLADDGISVVIVNAFAKVSQFYGWWFFYIVTTVLLTIDFVMKKDQKSISSQATMAFYYKPLTYNSQVAGYLIRSYPSDWTVFDAVSKDVLKTFTDDEILVENTNTPDLRESGRLVQKSVDLRAIKARGS